MSIYQCNACGRLTEAANVERHGSRCGVRLSGSTWCQGTYNEHGCGGPKEACGAEGCQECGGSRATSDIDLHAKVARLTAEVERLTERDKAAEAMFRDGEWNGRGQYWFGPCCPNCGGTTDTGHGADCPRAAWLAGCKS